MARAAAEARADERRVAVGAFLTLFGILAAHTVLETARDALFLARLPADQLPWVYLAMAAVAVVLTQVPALRAGRGMRGGLSWSLAAMAAGTFGLAAVGSWTNPWMLRLLYVWTGVVGTLATMQFWLVIGDLYTITQAKRLFRLIGTGSLAGAVGGGALAGAVSMRFGAEALTPIAALLMVLTAAGPARWLARTTGGTASAPVEGRWTWDLAREILEKHPYVTRLAGLVLVSSVAVTLADYVFKSAVARNVPAHELGAFFAVFYTVMNVLALVAQVAVMGWLLRALGLHRTLWVLPVLLVAGGFGFVLGGGLAAAVLLKGADGVLRTSVHRTAIELLFVPIPDGLRARVKPVIDVVGQRGGQAVASLLILSQLALQRGDAVLAGVVIALCVVWMAAAAEMRPHYVELFRAALRAGSIESRGELPQVDLESLEALFAALNSANDAEVVSAIQILREEGRARLIPALILYHPSRQVVLSALEVFASTERKDFIPITDRLLSHADAEVRAAALRARSAARADEAPLRAAIHDTSPLVQATAVVGLVSSGWVTDEAQRVLDSLAGGNDPAARLALARAIQQQPSGAFADTLLDLSLAPEADVQAAVAAAMGTLQDERFLPALLQMLGRYAARPPARQALVAFGRPALTFLAEALRDVTVPHELRRHIPRTLTRFPPRDVAPILLERLIADPDGMVRFKVLRGLGRLATNHPELPLHKRILREATVRTLEGAFRLAHWRQVLVRGAEANASRRTRGHDLLVTLLRDKEVHAVERVFRLLALQIRSEDFQRIWRGLRNDDAKVRSSSRELLENVVKSPVREAVLALAVESGDPLVASDPFYRAEPLDYETLLTRLLEQPGETVRCLAAYHVGELGLGGFRARIESLRAQETRLFVARVFERTLRLLPGELAHAG